MTDATQRAVQMRIVIRDPVPNVLYSLQSGNSTPLDPKRSDAGAPLQFDFGIRVAPGPKFFGDQVRREGPVRRFVYIRIGDLAGDAASPWSRRMKIDIHDLDSDLIAHGAAGGTIEIVVNGTATDGTPACATVRPLLRRAV